MKKKAFTVATIVAITFLALLLRFDIIQNGGGDRSGTDVTYTTLWTQVIAIPTAHAVEKNTKESVYDRVMRTGKIRCGYFVYEPAVVYDLNTGKLSGIIPDIMENLGKRLGLEIVWTEEVGLGTMLAGLEQGRYDMVCSSIWALADRGPKADFSRPLWYSGVGVYVRGDDERFSAKNLAAINHPDIKISSIDGTIPHILALQDYPKAQLLSLPQLTDYSFNLINVANNKADVTFVEVYQARDFLESNPGDIKNIVPGNPVRIYPNTLVMPKGDFRLYTMINLALDEQLNNGIIDHILNKYEKYPGSFYRVAKPYAAAE